MASVFNCSLLPNPLTPSALVPPDVAHTMQIAQYILVGTMGAFLWSILSDVVDDYKLLTTTKVSVGTTVYFLSRIFTFGYILGGTLFQTYPLKRCHLALTIVASMSALAVPTTALLFFLRARAIFDRNPYFVFCIFLAWLSVLGTSLIAPIEVKGGNLGPTDFCVTVSAPKYIGSAGVSSNAVYDTLIFLSISWRLFQNSYVQPDRGFKGNLWAFLSGQCLHQFSRAILQDGQLYYLIIVASNLLSVAMFYAGSIYSTTFTVPILMVANVMACNVFRNTKLGFQRRVVTTSELKTRDISSILFMHSQTSGSGRVPTLTHVDADTRPSKVHPTKMAEAPASQDSESSSFVVEKGSNLV